MLGQLCIACKKRNFHFSGKVHSICSFLKEENLNHFLGIFNNLLVPMSLLLKLVVFSQFQTVDWKKKSINHQCMGYFENVCHCLHNSGTLSSLLLLLLHNCFYLWQKREDYWYKMTHICPNLFLMDKQLMVIHLHTFNFPHRMMYTFFKYALNKSYHNSQNVKRLA